MRTGFGSQYNQMTNNFYESIWEDRAFVLDPTWLLGYLCDASSAAVGAKGYSSCFEEVHIGPPSCKPAMIEELRANVSDLPSW